MPYSLYKYSFSNGRDISDYNLTNIKHITKPLTSHEFLFHTTVNPITPPYRTFHRRGKILIVINLLRSLSIPYHCTDTTHTCTLTSICPILFFHFFKLFFFNTVESYSRFIRSRLHIFYFATDVTFLIINCAKVNLFMVLILSMLHYYS